MSTYYRLSYKLECCFPVVDTYMCKNTHLIECAGIFIFSTHCTQTLFYLLHSVSSSDICSTITFEQTGHNSSLLCKKKTACTHTCYNSAFIFQPIIGESIRECERSTHKRPVSCLQARGEQTVRICQSVCLTVSRDKRGDTLI